MKRALFIIGLSVASVALASLPASQINVAFAQGKGMAKGNPMQGNPGNGPNPNVGNAGPKNPPPPPPVDNPPPPPPKDNPPPPPKKPKASSSSQQSGASKFWNGYVISGVACSAVLPIALTLFYQRALTPSEGISSVVGCWTFGIGGLLVAYTWNPAWDALYTNTPVSRQQP